MIFALLHDFFNAVGQDDREQKSLAQPLCLTYQIYSVT